MSPEAISPAWVGAVSTRKPQAPSISETIDWARTLVYLGRNEVTPEVLGDTLHVLLKYQSDIAKARKELGVDAPPSIRK